MIASLDGAEFDALVIGTRTAQCVLAAALAKAGGRVLHVDGASFYGGAHSTERRLGSCVDQTPKVLYSRGKTVQTLVDSGVAEYVRFIPLEAVGVLVEGRVVEVPYTKSALLSCSALSATTKRKLLRVFSACRDYVDVGLGSLKTELTALDLGASVPRPQNAKPTTAHDEDEPFVDFLRRELAGCELAVSLIMFGVLFRSPASSHISFKEGARAVGRAASATGRFGGTPFVAPTYGCSEVLQGFCRSAAVHGGVYALNTGVASVGEGAVVLESDGVKCAVKAGAVFMDDSDAPLTSRVYVSTACDDETRRLVVIPSSSSSGVGFAFRQGGMWTLVGVEDVESVLRSLGVTPLEISDPESLPFDGELEFQAEIDEAELKFHSQYPDRALFEPTSTRDEDDQYDFT